ncbi:MAG: AsmA family protein, partial [Candidatus Marinimicrobia bacterium]|nr:AsmA family protein [Candidatus Neomarinimicrobiota bacterium]
MKRSLKISLYILFYIFVLLTIFAFIFIHTPYSKNKLKNYLATQVEKRTGLHLQIESLYGNLVNNVQLTNVKLIDKNKASILSVNEAEIGYNLFSIFSDSPEINSLYLNGVKIDSLPKIQQKTQASKFHMNLPEVYIENLRYSQKANIVFSVLYGQLNISPQHNSIQIDTGSVKIASVNEKFDIGELKASLRGDTVQLEKAKIYNRAASIDLKGFYEFAAQNGQLDIAGRDIRVHNRLPGLSRLVNTEDFVNVSSKTQIEGGSISSEINFSGNIRNQNITRGQAYLTISDNNISVPNLEFQSQDELFTGSLQGDLSGNIVSELNIHNLDLKKWQFLGRET